MKLEYRATAPVLGAGTNNVSPQCDAAGNHKVTQATLEIGEDETNGVRAVVTKPLAVSTYCPTADTSAAAEASSVSKASPGVLYRFTFTNTNAATRYLQFFNSTTVPANGTVPVLSFACAAGATITETFLHGKYFSTGLTWCNSSTAGTKTIGAADSVCDINFM